MTPQESNQTNPECGAFYKATDSVSSKGQCYEKQSGMRQGLGLVKRYRRHRKQSRWESFGEEEDGHRKLREPHLIASICSMAERKATSETEEADLGRQLRGK